MVKPRSSAQRCPVLVLELAVAVVGLRLLAPAFISTSIQTTPKFASRSNLRGSGLTALGAEGDGEKDGGFLKFLKVEQDIELSPEEYKMAMDQEIEAQRKKYYIGGVVKKANLVVPWKPVDEKQLEKDARKQLKKNGIKDPSGDSDDNEEDSAVDLTRVGDDVRLDWTSGAPGLKVGYVIERKAADASNFQEIATYDNMKMPQLLVKQYAGHEYYFMDEMVPPGKYTYRVLCRVRSGEINVVDQKDFLVAEAAGVDSKIALAVLAAFILVSGLVGFTMDPGVQP